MFENSKVELKDIPQFEDVLLESLSDNYKKVILLGLLIRFLVGTLVSIIIFFMISTSAKWLSLLVSFIVLASIFYSLKSYSKKKYAFRTKDVIYKSGWWSTSIEIMPFNRIQHVVLSQSWIEKKYGLSTLEMYSAVSDSSSISIPGLHFEDASRWKDYVLNEIEIYKNESAD